jgi:hypothetical protein
MTHGTGTTASPATPTLAATDSDDARRLADAQACSVVLPAGCGKTELLARAVLHNSSSSDASQLVLTHTHAGVHAVTTRLRRLKVPPGAVHVTTIAGWALRIASSYPRLSGLTEPAPTTSAGWNAVHTAAAAALASPHLRRMLTASYGGVYVDEYQDCVIRQHGLVLRLAEGLPTRLLGDPLQSIFGFGGNTVVGWDTDVTPHFPPLPVACYPWRWATTNPRLGDWLQLDLRKCLLEGLPVDLDDTPMTWRRTGHPAAPLRACREIIELPGSAVAIRQHAGQCHALARQLSGQFTSMEELESQDLLAAADALDQTDGIATVSALLTFAKQCIARLPPALDRAVRALQAGRQPSVQFAQQHPDVHRSLLVVVQEPSPGSLLEATQAIEQMPEIAVFRRELWRELQRAARVQRDESRISLRDAVLTARDRTRRHGREVEHRSVSRTLLIKGLEYEHAIVLDADSFDVTNLYVAMTRGSTSLTVLSAHSRLAPRQAR